jgi:hypothetical protein
MHIRKQTSYGERIAPGRMHIRLHLVGGHTLHINRGRNRIIFARQQKLIRMWGKVYEANTVRYFVSSQ